MVLDNQNQVMNPDEFWIPDRQLGLAPLVFRKELHHLGVSFGRRAKEVVTERC